VKTTITYALVFVFAFIGTSAVIYVLNDKFVNIFEFDFRDASIMEDATMYQSIANGDSLITVDSLFVEDGTEVFDDDYNSENSKSKQQKGDIVEVKEEITKQKEKIKKLEEKFTAKEKEEHKSWLKSTIKMYEAMQAEKASQLLASIPDKDAREILYSMKKKKAAEILSNLPTETVIRLTRPK
jgi:flagellar motility protein MotE (MotC chaperone)